VAPADQAGGTAAGIWQNNGLGVLSQVQALGPLRGFVAADLDGDADIDLVGANVSNVAAPSIVIVTNLGGGVPGFSTQTVATLGAGAQIGALNVADADSDGDLDVLVPVYVSNQLLGILNGGPGVWTPLVLGTVDLPASSPALTGGRATAFDVDGDAWNDLVYSARVTGTAVSSAGDSPVQILRRTGMSLSSFTERSRYAAFGFTLAFDADDDGDADLMGSGLTRSRAVTGLQSGLKRQYGQGTPGSGGLPPHLGARGPVRTGFWAELRVAQALSGSNGVLAIGFNASNIPNSPLPGLTSYAAAAAVLLPFVQGPGNSHFPTFLAPSLAGQRIFLQAALADAAGPGGVIVTNGLEILIGY
jgi:hypothetical protein